MYQRKADVLNRGFSGYNSAWLLLMLPDLFARLFRRRPPALVTIWLGALICWGAVVDRAMGMDRRVGGASFPRLAHTNTHRRQRRGAPTIAAARAAGRIQGTNNTSPQTPPPRPHIRDPHTHKQDNLEGTVRFFRRLSNRHREVAILLITPPPLHEGDWEAFLQVRACVRACITRMCKWTPHGGGPTIPITQTHVHAQRTALRV